MALPDLRQIENRSIQDLPDAREQGASFFWIGGNRGYALSAWGTRQRERELRLFYRHEYNWMGQSAVGGITKRVSSTRWEIKGQRRVRYFQDVLRQADFGRGWASLVDKVLIDFHRQDGGAYIEVIAPGNPMRPPTGPVIGLAHLDSIRCYPTGDPEYPVIYYSRYGKMHILHRSRVIHIVDMSDGDETQPGYGLCAFSRAISLITQQIDMGKYVSSQLDDKPSPGYVVAQNINKQVRDKAFEAFVQEQGNDEKAEWGRWVWLYGMDAGSPVKLEVITFAQAPPAWSYKEYTELYANAWALALGVDVQELWQLTGGNLGSGAQSEVLSAKSQGRALGFIYAELARGINNTLPESLEFSFLDVDPLQSERDAKTAVAWSEAVTAAGDALTRDEKRRILAAKVDAYKEVLTNEDGEIAKLGDLDVQPETTAGDETPQPVETTPPADEQAADSEKAIQATRIDFESDFADLLSGARSGQVNRRRFGIILRDMLRRYGRDAYRDGLKDGGVDGEMDAEDDARYLALLAEQSQYVTKLGDELYNEGGITDGQAALRPGMWFNKSISAFHDAGRASADANGLYEWAIGATEQHCKDCARLDTQRHRMKDWVRKGLLPRRFQLECHGFQCQCQLVRVTGKARGRF